MSKVILYILLIILPLLCFSASDDLSGIINRLELSAKRIFTNSSGEIFIKITNNFDLSIYMVDAKEQTRNLAKIYAINFEGGKADRMFFLNEMFESLRTYQYFQSSHTIQNNGYITSFTELTDWAVTNEKDNSFLITLYSKIKYENIQGGIEPHFFINAAMNTSTNIHNKTRLSYSGNIFLNGEEMELHIQTEDDGYIYIYNIEESGICDMIFPNKYDADNIIRAGLIFILPTDIERKAGLKYTLGVSPNSDETLGIIRIVTVKKPLINADITNFDAFAGIFVKINRDELEFYDIGYRVIKNN